MLESLRDYPHELSDLYFREYSDGILAGVSVQVRENSLIVGAGIVKHGGRIYTLMRECELPYEACGQEIALKLRFYPAEKDGDFTVYRTELLLVEADEAAPDEMELARFKLKEGAKLRRDYRSFTDFATEYNTLNLLHAEYAGFRQSTLHPELLRYFAAEMMKSRTANPHDLVFAMHCLNTQAVDREAILHYVAARSGRDYKAYTNVQIHTQLCRILEDAGSGGRQVPGGRFGAPQRMIVD